MTLNPLALYAPIRDAIVFANAPCRGMLVLVIEGLVSGAAWKKEWK